MKICNRKIQILLCILTLLAMAGCCLLVACTPKITVVFDANYEGAQKTEVVLKKGVLAVPEKMSREGYLFDGWYLEKTCQNKLQVSSAQPKDGDTYYAKWIALPQSLEATAIGDVFVGTVLPKANVNVTVAYYDGTTRQVTDFVVDLSGISQTSGEKQVTVSYTENGTTVSGVLTVNVKEILPQSVEVVYSGGELWQGDQLDQSKITVKVHYNNGKSKYVDNFSVTGFDSQTAGEQTVTVSYTENGVTITSPFTVTVKAVLLQNLTVSFTGGELWQGDQLDQSKIIATATYNHGEPTVVQSFEVSGFDSQTVGTQTVTVSYTENGTTVSGRFTVVVKQVLPQSIEVSHTSNDLWVGSTLQDLDIAVNLVFNNGTTKQITDFAVEGFSSATSGTKTITVSVTVDGQLFYQAFNVRIKEVLPQSIDIVYSGGELWQGDQLDQSKIAVKVIYNNGSVVDASTFAVENFDNQTVGTQTIIVNYTEKGIVVSGAFTVEVSKVVPQSLSVSYSEQSVWVLNDLDQSKITAKVIYSNGSEANVSTFTVNGFDNQTVGSQTVTVSYTESDTTVTGIFSVDVLEPAISNIEAHYTGDTIYDGDDLSLEDIDVEVHYQNGAKRHETHFSVTGFDSESAGSCVLTVTYNDGTHTFSAQFSVDIVWRTLVGLSATYPSSVLVGEQPRADEFVVTATFNNGTIKNIDNFSLSSLDSTTAGTKNLDVSFTWQGVTKSCQVQIVVVSNGTVASSSLSIHFLELGNAYSGDCIYIKAGDTDILIDAGSRDSSASTIAAYVDQYCTDGILEYVIATHAHRDHIAGFVGNQSVPGIFARYECKTIIQFARTEATSQVYKNYCTERDKEVAAGAKLFTALECYNESKEGAQRVYDLTGDGSITMEILYQRFYVDKSGDGEENDYSVCVLITQGENHYLLTGDLEADGEASLVQSNPDLPEVVLFKGGHHGSYTATTAALLSKIKPQYVCVCCCAGNVEYLTKLPQNLAHSFPAQEFIDRVAPYTEHVYVTTLGRIKWDDSKGKWVNDSPAYVSMNGNIVFSCINGVVSLQCSNNNLKLKDTEWFQNNRTMPDAWANGTSMYR